MIDVREVNPREWKEFLLNHENTLFVQSPSYGEFYEAMGEKYYIFGVYNNDVLLGGSLVLTTHAKRGNFLYLPYGPIASVALSQEEKVTYLNVLVQFLGKFAKDNNYHFLRVSPFVEEKGEYTLILQKMGFRPAPMHVLAETTWLLDLSKSEDELLMAMNKNHRNLIRRCMKDGATVTQSTDESALALFNDMHDETAKRHRFTRFSRSYIEKEFRAFAPHNEASVFVATLADGRVDSSAIIMYFGNMAAYRHGASYGLNSKNPTSYLIQWEAILEAKRRGMKWYNFWGIAPNGASKNHPFYGITHFKKGFGGFQKDLLHCHDYPTSPRYWINWTVETARRLKRGF